MKKIRYHKENKIVVLTHYGDGKCACVRCGENRLACLSIDHINGKGELERKQRKRKGGHPYYEWLKRQNFPKGYQTLCMNCQFVKREENNEYASVYRKAQVLDVIKQLIMNL